MATANQRPVGLNNTFGNACYMITSLQMLYRIPEVRKAILEYTEDKNKPHNQHILLIKTIFEHFDKGISDTKDTLRNLATLFVNQINERREDKFSVTSQMDIGEFYPLVIEAVLSELELLPLFQFQQNTVIDCLYPSGNIIKDTQTIIKSPENLSILVLTSNEFQQLGETNRNINSFLTKYDDLKEKVNYKNGCPDPKDETRKGPYRRVYTSESLDTQRYLFVYVNRTLFGNKDKTVIDVSNPLRLTNAEFDLVGIALHSGETIDGGHYIFYEYGFKEGGNTTEFLWNCNDTNCSNDVSKNDPFPSEKTASDKINKHGVFFLYKRRESTSPTPTLSAASTSPTQTPSIASTASTPTPSTASTPSAASTSSAITISTKLSNTSTATIVVKDGFQQRDAKNLTPKEIQGINEELVLETLNNPTSLPASLRAFVISVDDKDPPVSSYTKALPNHSLFLAYLHRRLLNGISKNEVGVPAFDAELYVKYMWVLEHPDEELFETLKRKVPSSNAKVSDLANPADILEKSVDQIQINKLRAEFSEKSKIVQTLQTKLKANTITLKDQTPQRKEELRKDLKIDERLKNIDNRFNEINKLQKQIGILKKRQTRKVSRRS